jgi:hypothetical protein
VHRHRRGPRFPGQFVAPVIVTRKRRPANSRLHPLPKWRVMERPPIRAQNAVEPDQMMHGPVAHNTPVQLPFGVRAAARTTGPTHMQYQVLRPTSDRSATDKALSHAICGT